MDDKPPKVHVRAHVTHFKFGWPNHISARTEAIVFKFELCTHLGKLSKVSTVNEV